MKNKSSFSPKDRPEEIRSEPSKQKRGQSEDEILDEVFQRSWPEIQRELLKKPPLLLDLIVRKFLLLIIDLHCIFSIFVSHAITYAARGAVRSATLLLAALVNLISTARLCRKLWGWILIIAGGACYLGFAAFWGVSTKNRPVGEVLLLFSILLVLIFGARWLCSFGFRLRAQVASNILLKDKRAPVLYLRPFIADFFNGWSHHSHPSFEFARFLIPKTIESWVARPLRRLGPLVALYPFRAEQIGPYISPIFVDDGNWQQRFFEVLQETQLIFFVMPRATVGVQWEIGQILERCVPSRVLILYCAKPSDFLAFSQETLPMPFEGLPKLIISQWRHVYKKGPHGLPSLVSILSDVFSSGLLPVVVSFDEIWSPKLTWAPTTLRGLWRTRRLNLVASAVTVALEGIGL